MLHLGPKFPKCSLEDILRIKIEFGCKGHLYLKHLNVTGVTQGKVVVFNYCVVLF